MPRAEAGSYILASNTVEFDMPAYPGLYPVFRRLVIVSYRDVPLLRSRPGQTPPAWVTPVCSLSIYQQRSILRANGPVSLYTDTRIRSLEPRSSLSGQDMILSANQIHQGSEPSEGVRSLEPAVATTHYAPQEASKDIGARHPIYC